MATGGKSSRIIVKNLPKQISDERVKEHFAQKGEITDVKLKFTRYGREPSHGVVRRSGWVHNMVSIKS